MLGMVFALLMMGFFLFVSMLIFIFSNTGLTETIINTLSVANIPLLYLWESFLNAWYNGVDVFLLSLLFTGSEPRTPFSVFNFIVSDVYKAFLVGSITYWIVTIGDGMIALVTKYKILRKCGYVVFTICSVLLSLTFSNLMSSWLINSISFVHSSSIAIGMQEIGFPFCISQATPHLIVNLFVGAIVFLIMILTKEGEGYKKASRKTRRQLIIWAWYFVVVHLGIPGINIGYVVFITALVWVLMLFIFDFDILAVEDDLKAFKKI